MRPEVLCSCCEALKFMKETLEWRRKTFHPELFLKARPFLSL